MESIEQYFQSIGLNFWQFLIGSAILLLGTLLMGTVARFLFGKNSNLSHSVSGTIGILFLYALTVVLHSLGAQFQSFVAPLPFVTISGDTLYLFAFDGTDYTLVCSELLNMIILAFLANLVGALLPKARNFFLWVLSRSLTIVVAMVLHLLIQQLFTSLLPQGILTYAPVILLAILVLMLLTGALRFLVGLVLTSVNPLIAAFYTFFFATLVGKQLTRAVMTTILLSALVYALNCVNIFAVSIASAALMAYIPFVVLLVLLWYTIERVF